MLTRNELCRIADARLRDARTLLKGKRYDGAVYLCGYAVEIRLKAQIVKTLHWQGFPTTQSEFHGYGCFKTHDLDVLLHLTGRESAIKKHLLAEWSTVKNWKPETRYEPVGNVKRVDAQGMIAATEKLLRAL